MLWYANGDNVRTIQIWYCGYILDWSQGHPPARAFSEQPDWNCNSIYGEKLTDIQSNEATWKVWVGVTSPNNYQRLILHKFGKKSKNLKHSLGQLSDNLLTCNVDNKYQNTMSEQNHNNVMTMYVNYS